MCTISIVFSMLSMEWWLSKRCCANLDFWLLYLKSLVCSLNRVLKGRPVCPVYFIAHVGHLS
jgi:hypothetical protein